MNEENNKTTRNKSLDNILIKVIKNFFGMLYAYITQSKQKIYILARHQDIQGARD